MRGADLACHRWRYDFRMADDTPDEIPWYAPGHHRVGIPRQRQPGEESWRLRHHDGRV